MTRTVSHDPTRERPTVVLNRAGFDAAMARHGDTSIVAFAARAGISRATVHRVRSGQTVPGEEFIAAALAAFPQARFEDLFTVQR